MVVDGRADIKVDVKFNDCLKCVLKKLGYKEDEKDIMYRILEPDEIHNTTGKRAIYRLENISYHGSPSYEYKLVSHDELDVEKYELALKLIKVAKADKERKTKEESSDEGYQYLVYYSIRYYSNIDDERICGMGSQTIRNSNIYVLDFPITSIDDINSLEDKIKKSFSNKTDFEVESIKVLSFSLINRKDDK